MKVVYAVVLLSTTNLTGLELSLDRSSVLVSAGENWDAIYRYLEPYGLSVVGSRIGVVGVPGFLLGGVCLSSVTNMGGHQQIS